MSHTLSTPDFDFYPVASVAVPFGTCNQDSDHRFRAPVLELDAP